MAPGREIRNVPAWWLYTEIKITEMRSFSTLHASLRFVRDGISDAGLQDIKKAGVV